MSTLTLRLEAYEKDARQVIAGAQNLGDVQIGSPLDRRPQIDKRRLHTGQDPADAAFVDVSRDPALAFSLDEILNEDSVFEKSDTSLGPLSVHDEEVFRHGSTGQVERFRTPG